MILKLTLLCFAGFTASLIDSIAGGGGLISLPAFLMAGIDPYMALGTNKFSATAASLTSSLKFLKSGKVDDKLMEHIFIFTIIGAVIGVRTVLNINESILYTLVLILIIAVSVYSLFGKNVGVENRFSGLNKKNISLGMLLALALGFYDGFFGPGVGSFLIFGLIAIYGFDFVNACGNARVLNFLSNVVSMVIFAMHRQIDYRYGIPVAISMIIGARVGTSIALKSGSKLIKPIFVTMSTGVAAKMIWNILK